MRVEIFSGLLAQLHTNASCSYYIICKRFFGPNVSQMLKVFIAAILETLLVIALGVVRQMFVLCVIICVFIHA